MAASERPPPRRHRVEWVVKMQQRYIIIESNSGFVWGEATADDIIAAARAVDVEANGREADDYEEIDNPRDSSGYYIVHDATGSDIVVDDGQSQALIDAVEALPVVGYVRGTFDL